MSIAIAGTDAVATNQRVCKITPNPETLDKNLSIDSDFYALKGIG
ncbi:hypothetical protein [Escherichia coli]